MNYIVVDLEATCEQENRKDFRKETIEIGAALVRRNMAGQLEIQKNYSIFIKPIINPLLTDFCTQLTSITQADVDAAQLFPKAASAFKTFIGNEPYMLLSWGGYDANQLKRDCKLHGIDDSWVKNHVNLKQEFMDLHKFKRCGLTKALAMLNIKFDGTRHRGVDDAINISRIFISIFDEINRGGKYE